MPVTREQAAELARISAAPEVCQVTDALPENCNVYAAPDDCWYAILVSGSDALITSSRLICIDKETGEVL